MIAFRDRTGRLWTGRLDVSAAIRMRDLAGVDVMELALDPDAATTLGAEPSRLVDAAFAILLPSCEQRGVSDRQFGKALRGRLWGRAVNPGQLAEQIFDAIRMFFEIPELSPGKPKGGKEPSEPLTASLVWGLVWRHAAVACVDPGPRTFGELVALCDAKRKHDWAQTASLISKIHNVNCYKRSDLKSPGECDPTGGLGAVSHGQKLPLTRENFLSAVSLLMGR